MRILILATLLLTACNVRAIAVLETSDAINGTIEIRKDQKDEKETPISTPVPTLPPSN